MTKIEAHQFTLGRTRTVIPGCTTRRTKNGLILIRKATNHRPRTVAQRNAATYVTALATAWKHYATTVMNDSPQPIEAYDPDIYRAWLKMMHARRSSGLLPQLAPWGTPFWPIPTLDLPSQWPHHHAIELTPTPLDGFPIYFYVTNWNPDAGQLTTDWRNERIDFWRPGNPQRLIIDRLPTGALFFVSFGVDRWGRATDYLYTDAVIT